jgi:hypothetical protein
LHPCDKQGAVVSVWSVMTFRKAIVKLERIFFVCAESLLSLLTQPYVFVLALMASG